MRIHSVNVSQPGKIALRNSTVPTGIFKQPVDGRVRVLFDRVAGDYSAEKYDWGGPTQAALVYQIENIEFWRERINAPDYGPGFFGENFTVDNMPDDEVYIGNIYRFGSAVFQVTKHRPPCRKICARVGDPAFAKEFLHSRRFGFYMRVLEEGDVSVGDEIELVKSDPIAMSVAEYGTLLDIDHSDSSAIRSALEITSLEHNHRKRIEGFLQKS